MPSILKPDMQRAWANNGAIVQPDDLKIDQGWIAEKPPFQNENWVQNRSDVFLQHLEERGTPQWDSVIIYSFHSLSYYQEEVWISLQNSNFNNPPDVNGGWWIPLRELSSPPGLIAMHGGTAAPEGWLLCDGAEISRSIYARLFTFIGDSWGIGDGATTFNLPDMQDRAPVGAGALLPMTGEVGSSTKVLTISNMPPHSHTFQYRPTGQALARDGHIRGYIGWSNRQTSTVGSGTAFNIMQPSIGINFIIKT